MLNSVFKKLMAAYVAIMIISFLILGLLFSQLTGSYFFQRHESLLLEEGNKLNDMVIAHLNGRISAERLNLELQAVERFLNTRIWVLDRRGMIYGVSSNEKQWIGRQITEKEMLQVLQGSVIVKKGVFDAEWKVPMLTVGMPIIINGRVENALIMHSPLYEITDAIQGVHRIIWIAMGISFLVSTLIIYFVSKRMASPLRAMGVAAERLAAGDFTQRITIDTEDEIGQVTRTFNGMAEKLEAIEENRRSFIAAVAHELRSPLTLIKGFVEGILDGTVEEKDQRKYLQVISKEAGRLNKLTANLLDLQKMESDQYPIRIQVFDINELIRRTLLKYDEEIERRNLEISLGLEGEKLMVTADRDAMEQVLTNLIDNAMKFVENRGAIELTSKAHMQRAWITVRDNGMGIPREEQPSIWERFYKVDKSRNRNKEGTGLGLYIVKKIIDRHGEQIRVESEVGKGTAFTFTLPLAEVRE
ncbi:Signal transduction histidine kinase [Geosporobacter subterraneus DSM 17957]|uniref:histidine kinase n=1 Tax=Geosporobacter subterraneus DSM 17957 TaxID=1121919 RepID=A0A1M6DM96_9FIRM|nr:HAMP domain-containing sensor histidine kinase [Geosporobacter subterraneus]SHI74199.1 Signal transduction histidine kinase [Geosporobacter subterraneus DSM 17957]